MDAQSLPKVVMPNRQGFALPQPEWKHARARGFRIIRDVRPSVLLKRQSSRCRRPSRADDEQRNALCRQRERHAGRRDRDIRTTGDRIR